MNRELKFRVWSKNLNRFYSGEYFSSEDLYAEENNIVQLSYDDWVIQQYTGLKDRNGVEVYEGDIVEYTYKALDDNGFVETLQVVWDTFYCGFAFALKDGRGLNHTGLKFINSPHGNDNYKVIGNIFENPELLK